MIRGETDVETIIRLSKQERKPLLPNTVHTYAGRLKKRGWLVPEWGRLAIEQRKLSQLQRAEPGKRSIPFPYRITDSIWRFSPALRPSTGISSSSVLTTSSVVTLSASALKFVMIRCRSTGAATDRM